MGLDRPLIVQFASYVGDVLTGNLGMSVRTLGALVEKFGLHGQQLGEVAMGAVIKHSSDWNLGREAALYSGLSPLTPGITLQRACGTSLDTIVHIAGKIATGQIEAGIGEFVEGEAEIDLADEAGMTEADDAPISLD